MTFSPNIHRVININSYIGDAEIVDYIINNGIRNRTELYRADKKIWEISRERGLLNNVFPELTKPNLDGLLLDDTEEVSIEGAKED